MPVVLIVEDNDGWSDILSRIVKEQGYSALHATDCISAKKMIQDRKIDLAIFDINLSGADRERDNVLSKGQSKRISSEEVCVEGEEGFHLVAWARHFYPEVGSIILTDRSDIQDQILGRDLGADDYALKPVNVYDLQARLRSLLRRVGAKKAQTYVFGKWEFDVEKSTLKNIGVSESPISIAVNESEIKALKLLTNRLGSVVSRSTLCNYILGRPLGQKDRAIDNIISKLRSKLDDGLSDRASHITTVQGAGYRLEPFVVGR